MAVNFMCRGLGYTLAFILGVQPYRAGWATVQRLAESLFKCWLASVQTPRWGCFFFLTCCMTKRE